MRQRESWGSEKKARFPPPWSIEDIGAANSKQSAIGSLTTSALAAAGSRL